MNYACTNENPHVYMLLLRMSVECQDINYLLLNLNFMLIYICIDLLF